MHRVNVLTIATIVITGCSSPITKSSADDNRLEASGRVIIAASTGRTVKMPSYETSWRITYKFITPPIPNSETWNYRRSTFYVWGDIDFDSYGSEGRYKISSFKYNQIVPQLMIGRVLSGNFADFKAKFSNQNQWFIQAQYFWSDGTPYAQVGNLVRVFPGDSFTEEITYNSKTGIITAVISGPQGASSIDIVRPFPSAPELFSNWTEFFRKAQSQSSLRYILAKPEMNIEPHDVDKQTTCSILPLKVTYIEIPAVSTFNQTIPQGLPCLGPATMTFVNASIDK